MISVSIRVICLYCGDEGAYDKDDIARCDRCRCLEHSLERGERLDVAPWLDGLEGPILIDSQWPSPSTGKATE